MADKIKVRPVDGKYLSATVDGKSYDIFLVDPTTGEQGTAVPRDVAVRLMASKHPIIALVPVIENGVFVQQFTAEELSEIAEIKSNPEKASEIANAKKTETNATLEALVATQAAQLKLMTEQMAELKEQIKSAKKSSKKEE